MSIGENIKRLRMKCNLSQSELAEQVGVTQSMIAQIERGSKVPTMVLGKEIANVLQCSIEELMAEDNAMTNRQRKVRICHLR